MNEQGDNYGLNSNCASPEPTHNRDTVHCPENATSLVNAGERWWGGVRPQSGTVAQ